MTLGPLMIDLVGTSVLPEERDMLAHPLVGGVILFARNYESPEQLLQLTRDIHAVRTPPLLIGVDHEGGRVQRFRTGFSRLPPARRLGQLFDTDRTAGLNAARSMGWLMAAELRAHGVDLSFAPTVDLDYGLNEAIGDRALHPTARCDRAVGCRVHDRDARCRHGGDGQTFPRSWRSRRGLTYRATRRSARVDRSG